MGFPFEENGDITYRNFARRLLRHRFGLSEGDAKSTQVIVHGFDILHRFKYANISFRLETPVPITTGLGYLDNNNIFTAIGCSPVPSGTREFILRVSSPDTNDLPQSQTRVQNEVGMLELASAALNGTIPREHEFLKHIVPRVFAWADPVLGDPENPGWVLQENKHGEALEAAMETKLSWHERDLVRGYIVTILKSLQNYPLPSGITEFGGVKFNEFGCIVSGPMPTVGEGPWPTVQEVYKDRLRRNLAKSDANPDLRGWRDDGFRRRLDDFTDIGVDAYLEVLNLKQEKVIAHGDIVPKNFIFDPSTCHITGMFGFEFASIQHPSYEFLYSFSGFGGTLGGWPQGDTILEKEFQASLQHAKHIGRFSEHTPRTIRDTPHRKAAWDQAKEFEEDLEGQCVLRPRKIEGMREIAEINDVLERCFPRYMSHRDYQSLTGSAMMADRIRKERATLQEILDHIDILIRD